MIRLSIIINEIYLKYLPLAEKMGITLNLDFSDSTVETKDAERVKKDLEKTLRKAVTKANRSPKNQIKIYVNGRQIIIEDENTVLSKAVCTLLTRPHFTVKSKVGFGTTVTIDF